MRGAVFDQAHPERGPDRRLTLRQAMDRAADELQRQPPKSPLVEASIWVIFGDINLGLGEPEVARKHWWCPTVIARCWEGLKSLSRAERRSFGADGARPLACFGLW